MNDLQKCERYFCKNTFKQTWERAQLYGGYCRDCNIKPSISRTYNIKDVADLNARIRSLPEQQKIQACMDLASNLKVFPN